MPLVVIVIIIIIIIIMVLLLDCNTQPSCLVCQKYARKHKGAVKMCTMVLKMCITCKQKCNRNVCELWIAELRVVLFTKLK